MLADSRGRHGFFLHGTLLLGSALQPGVLEGTDNGRLQSQSCSLGSRCLPSFGKQEGPSG